MIFYVSFVLAMGYLQLEMYNTERPHEALNNMTPIEYRNMKQIA